jgi:chromate transporter
MSSAPPLGEALAWWFKLGCTSFGGPAGQVAQMHRELVERRRWIGERRFVHALDYCMLLPGPEAQQLATYMGWLMHGVWGGVAAGTLFVLPGALVIVALAWTYAAFGDAPLVTGLLRGLEPAVLAVVVHAAWRIARRTLRTPLLIAIAVATLIARIAVDAPFPLLLAVAGAVGVVAPRLVGAEGGHQAPTAAAGEGAAAPFLLADDAAPPEHARFTRARVFGPIAVGIVLGAIGAAFAQAASPGLLAPMARFFTGAALLTFGGAYAVLPYVRDGAVQMHGWVTDADMMAALALGESTPGPLVLVNTFVAFVGGWRAEGSPGTALAAAAVVTMATFLPSFVFVLAGGPVVEATRGDTRMAAPLAAMGAAVVAMIVDLAFTFMGHALWRGGPFTGLPDPFATGLAWAALLLLARYDIGIVRVFGGCALLGAVRAASPF